jgi:hypothetical protein
MMVNYSRHAKKAWENRFSAIENLKRRIQEDIIESKAADEETVAVEALLPRSEHCTLEAEIIGRWVAREFHKCSCADECNRHVTRLAKEIGLICERMPMVEPIPIHLNGPLHTQQVLTGVRIEGHVAATRLRKIIEQGEMCGYMGHDVIKDDIEKVFFLALRHSDEAKGIKMQTIPWNSFMEGDFKKRCERKDRSQFKEAQNIIESQLHSVACSSDQVLALVHTYQCNVTGLFIVRYPKQTWLSQSINSQSLLGPGALNAGSSSKCEKQLNWTVGALQRETPKSWSGCVRGSSYQIQREEIEAHPGDDDDDEEAEHHNTKYWGAMVLRFGCNADGSTFKAPPTPQSGVIDPLTWSNLVGREPDTYDACMRAAFAKTVFAFEAATEEDCRGSQKLLREPSLDDDDDCSVDSTIVPCVSRSFEGSKSSIVSAMSLDALESEAIAEIEACLVRVDPKTGYRTGLVKIHGWDEKYSGKLGSVRVFLERRPDRYIVEKGQGRRFKVFSLASPALAQGGDDDVDR